MNLSRQKPIMSALGLLALVLVGLTRAGGAPPFGPVPWGSFFHAQGSDLVSDATGAKVFFRGVNLNGLEFGSFFDNPYPGGEGVNYFRPRAVDFDRLRALGFNVIRVPIEWARLVPGFRPPTLPTELDPTYLAIVDDVVDMAAARELYVILDMHDFLKYWSAQSMQVCAGVSPDHQVLLAQTWRLLADHFKTNPAVLGYDLMNEPVRQEQGEACASCDWHPIAQRLVNAIRAVDARHLLFVEGPNFSLASHWPVENGKTAFITDAVTPPRIVYSPHVFFDFNNDSRYDQPGEDRGPIGRWRYYVRDRLLPAIDWSVRNQVPLFFGETNAPCTTAWAAVLDHVYRRFFEPLRLSATAWHYIDPDRCPLAVCELNLAACASEAQLTVLQRYPGGTFDRTDRLKPGPSDSRLYAGERVNPWDAGPGFFGEALVSFCAPDPLSGSGCTISVSFNQDNFAGVKFIHRYGIDTARYRSLGFSILLSGAGNQNFKFFTTSPRADCDPRPEDPVFPPFEARPSLTELLPSPRAGEWLHVQVPLKRIVDPTEPIINGIAFQNLGTSQEVFFLDDIALIPVHPPSVFWRHQRSGDVFLYRMSGPHIVSADLVGSVPDALWKIRSVDDYDGDGEQDIVWHRQGSGEVVLFRMEDGRVSSASLVVTIPDTRWQIQGSGDFDADGFADLLWRHQGSGDVFLFLMKGAVISSSGRVASVPDESWQIVGTGDYDGDGRSDILWRHRGTGDVVLFKMNGLEVSAVSFLTRIADPQWRVRGSGDYDGDGAADILWRHETSGDVVIFLMKKGSIASARLVARVADSDWQIRGASDYDGDGFADILWHHKVRGDVFLFLMEGATILSMRPVASVPDTDWQIVP